MSSPAFGSCPICDEFVTLRSNREAAFTVFFCSACGPYSLTNELVEALLRGNEPTPHPEIFREWLSRV